MSIFSTKSSFVIAAAVVGAVSFTNFAASAGPLFNSGCKIGQIVGCNPNTWTPNNNWNGGGFVTINLAQPVSADDGDCYYVRRKVFIPQVGVVSKRQLVCN